MLRDRNISGSSSKDNSDVGNNNYSDDEWDWPKINQRWQAIIHSTFTPVRQPTVSSCDFGNSDSYSNNYSSDNGNEDDIPRLAQRYTDDVEPSKEPSKQPRQTQKKQTEKKLRKPPSTKPRPEPTGAPSETKQSLWQGT